MELCDMRHRHIDVVQLHCADVLSCANGDALLPFVGSRTHSPLSDKLRQRALYKEKLHKYRVAFLPRHGYFAEHVILRPDSASGRIVSYVQAYNAAAKMARPDDVGGLVSTLVCGHSRTSARITATLDTIRQTLYHALHFAQVYVRDRNYLRLEEVVNIDSRFETLTQVVRTGVFRTGTLMDLTTFLLRNQLIYRFGNWPHHVSKMIGPDVAVMRHFLERTGTFDSPIWGLDYDRVRFAARAYFRWMIFLHGRDRRFNYQWCRNMLGSGEPSTDGNGVLTVRALIDTTDRFVVPMYAALHSAGMSLALQCITEVHRTVNDSLSNRPLESFVLCIATWSYTLGLRIGVKRDDFHRTVGRLLQFDVRQHFSARLFKVLYVESGHRHVRFNGTSDVDTMARKLTHGSSTFSTILRSTYSSDDVRTIKRLLPNFFRQHVHVLPLVLFETRHDVLLWHVLKHGRDDVHLPGRLSRSYS